MFRVNNVYTWDALNNFASHLQPDEKDEETKADFMRVKKLSVGAGGTVTLGRVV